METAAASPTTGAAPAWRVEALRTRAIDAIYRLCLGELRLRYREASLAVSLLDAAACHAVAGGAATALFLAVKFERAEYPSPHDVARASRALATRSTWTRS